MNKFLQARAEEIKYHERFYRETTLFAPGSWLSKPVKIIMEYLNELDLDGIRILDLGCGVGRNSIPLAQKVKDYNGRVTCVDLIPSAIEKLIDHAKNFDVEETMIADIADVEFYDIQQDEFTYIIACSCLEHVSNEDALRLVINKMIRGTKVKGINCILMSTEVQEYDLKNRRSNGGTNRT